MVIPKSLKIFLLVFIVSNNCAARKNFQNFLNRKRKFLLQVWTVSDICFPIARTNSVSWSWVVEAGKPPRPVGHALCPLFSLLCHSCVNNTRWMKKSPLMPKCTFVHLFIYSLKEILSNFYGSMHTKVKFPLINVCNKNLQIQPAGRRCHFGQSNSAHRERGGGEYIW